MRGERGGKGKVDLATLSRLTGVYVWIFLGLPSCFHCALRFSGMPDASYIKTASKDDF